MKADGVSKVIESSASAESGVSAKMSAASMWRNQRGGSISK
jgi:hypothetical protein